MCLEGISPECVLRVFLLSVLVPLLAVVGDKFMMF